VFKKKYQNIDLNFLDFYSTGNEDLTAKKVSGFYDIAPFPNYSEKETIESIITKGEKNLLIKSFLNFIGNNNKKILEVGAGTCQLSIYLAATSNNQIYSMDVTKKSLLCGYEFAKKNKIENIHFILADIFDDIFENNTFDYIICSGVLHHTKDSKKSFEIISKYLKTEGYILLGLYNIFGRFRTHVRQLIFKYINKNLAKFLDPYLRSIKNKNSLKFISWVRDQYLHPIERSHTFDETIKWFNENNIELINFVPSKFLNDNDDSDIFYKKSNQGNLVERVFEQIFMNFTKLGSEGGLFIAIGKKK
jgi:ubiquinone/menaquinone biosynthesis C-methylase UbiE